ncbi:MAG: Crp/Fnr family transcriptional regulator [Acidimicrobiia bacterium]
MSPPRADPEWRPGATGTSGLAGRTFAGFLAGLDPPAASALTAAGQVREIARGEVLCAAGEPAEAVYVVLAGAAKLTAWAANGRELVLDVVEPGALVGELAAIDGGPRTATVSALTELRVLAVPAGRFRALLAQQPSLNAAVLALLAGRVRVATERQVELGANDALGRVCRLLLDLAARAGASGDGWFPVPLSQHDLASWSGLSRDAFVKGLRAVRTLGWAELDGRRGAIVDRAALERRAAG